MVKKEHKKDVADKAFLTATQQFLAGNSTKTLMKKIIDRINRLYDTALNPRTVRRQIRMGLENIPPRIGRKGLLPVLIESALVNTNSSFVGFACAEQKQTPTRKELIGILSSCLREGPTTLGCYKKLYKKLYRSF